MKISKKFTLIILSIFTTAQFQFTAHASVTKESAKNKVGYFAAASNCVKNLTKNIPSEVVLYRDKMGPFTISEVKCKTTHLVAGIAAVAIVGIIAGLVILTKRANPPYEPKGSHGTVDNTHNQNGTDSYNGPLYQNYRNLDKKFDPKNFNDKYNQSVAQDYKKDTPPIRDKDTSPIRDYVKETLANLNKDEKNEKELAKIVGDNNKKDVTKKDVKNVTDVIFAPEFVVDPEIEEALKHNEKEQKELLEKLGTTKEEQAKALKKIEEEKNKK